MSRTAIKHPRRQEKRQQELSLAEQPHLGPYEGECCGGYCGEGGGDGITPILLAACPSPKNIANVFYGYVGGMVESWVDGHMKGCANCKQVMENLILLDHDFSGE